MFTNKFNGLPRQGQHFFFAKKNQKTLAWSALSCLNTRLNEQKFFGSFFQKRMLSSSAPLSWLPYFSDGHLLRRTDDRDGVRLLDIPAHGCHR